MYKLNARRIDQRAKLPVCANPSEDLGYDLFSLEDTVIVPGKVTIVRTGIAATAVRVERVKGGRSFTDEGWEQEYVDISSSLGLLIRDRSSMAAKGVFTHGGVIDAGYTGEIKVIMSKLPFSDDPKNNGAWRINAGDKIAQMVPVEVLTGETVEVEELSQSARGEGSFGSTGR